MHWGMGVGRVVPIGWNKNYGIGIILEQKGTVYRNIGVTAPLLIFYKKVSNYPSIQKLP